jgi:hypothetical protein
VALGPLGQPTTDTTAAESIFCRISRHAARRRPRGTVATPIAPHRGERR